MDNLQRIKEKLQELVIKSNQERDDEDNPNHSDGYGMYWSGFCNCLKELIPFVDSLPEESVSEDLEEAAKIYVSDSLCITGEEDWDDAAIEALNAYKAGAEWQKENLWKSADGDDLPEIDRDVIALLDNGKVVFAHRPPEYWDGKNIVTGKVTRNYPKTYDKGGWNIPNVKYWLDYNIDSIIKED